MRLRKYLTISYIFVMIIPILTGTFLYICIGNLGGIVAVGIFTIVFIGVFLLAIMLADKRLGKPVEMLINAMTKYENGENNVKINYKSDDEINDLINHFNLMKDKMEEKIRELDRTQKDKEYLIAGISNDLKASLISIRGYAESLKDYKNLTNRNIEDYTKVIISKSDYINNVLEDLLTYK